MVSTDSHGLATELLSLPASDPEYATQFVDRLLKAAQATGASDIHLLPSPAGLEVVWRIDGVLQPVGVFPAGSVSHIVTRLKVLADLLTYRTDIPQEGRLQTDPGVEMRLSTLPTLHGEKAVVRLFQSGNRFQRLDDLGLPADVRDALAQLLQETSGAILVTGPAGSGKTTTLYACLRELAARSQYTRSIVTLEDPIEVPLNGISQSQAGAGAGFDMATGLRAIVRQDPEVIMVGEIRDRETATVALQAALTGQLVLSSFHAGSAAGAISRLLDMGIEPYILQSGLLAVISQRLVRRLCQCAKSPGIPSNCAVCGGSGFHGRLVLAEILRPKDPVLHEAILQRVDANTLARRAIETGMLDLATQAKTAIEAGLTTEAEVRRVLGSH